MTPTLDEQIAWQENITAIFGENSRAKKMYAAILATLREAKAREAQQPVALQAGMSNDELRFAWSKKLPGVEPTDRLLGAFALGAEVGYERAAPVAPPGWVMVPKEPTREMRNAGAACCIRMESDEAQYTAVGLAWDVYTAMLSAAPKEPK